MTQSNLNKKDSVKNVSFKELSNEELVVIYNRFADYFDSLNDNLSKGCVQKNISTPVGPTIKVIKLSDSQIEDFRNTEFYKLNESIVNRLAPIVELILETNPKLSKL